MMAAPLCSLQLRMGTWRLHACRPMRTRTRSWMMAPPLFSLQLKQGKWRLCAFLEANVDKDKATHVGANRLFTPVEPGLLEASKRRRSQ